MRVDLELWNAPGGSDTPQKQLMGHRHPALSCPLRVHLKQRPERHLTRPLKYDLVPLLVLPNSNIGFNTPLGCHGDHASLLKLGSLGTFGV